MHPLKNPRAIREAARLSQLQLAARAGKSIPLVRLYEANPAAVTPASRQALEPIYRALFEASPIRVGK